MKNLLWFFYKPNDEREGSIYNKAFSRAYSTLIVGMALIIFAGQLQLAIMNSSDAILGMMGILGLLSYLAGWSALKYDELTLVYTEKADLKLKIYLPILALIGVLVICTAIAVNMGIMSTALVTPIAEILLALSVIAMIVWTWHSSQLLPTYARVVVSLLFFPGFILFTAIKKQNVVTFVLTQVLGFVINIAILLIIGAYLMLIVSVPIRVTTNHFEPTLTEGTRYITNLPTDLAIGDYIVIKNDNKELVVGKIELINGNEFTMDTSSGTQLVQKASIHREIVLDDN